MNLPFTTAQFFDVFEKYNTQVWPMQVVLYALALLVVLFAWRHRQASARSVMAILAGLWLWMGIVYHFMFFAAINPAANVFGTIFVIQGFILLYAGIIQPKLSFRIRMTLTGGTGLVFIAYALLIYPLIGMVFGHMFPRAPISVSLARPRFSHSVCFFSRMNGSPGICLLYPFCGLSWDSALLGLWGLSRITDSWSQECLGARYSF